MKTSPLISVVRNNSRCLLVVLAVLAWVQTGCQPKAGTSESTLARVGRDVIPEARFRAWWRDHRPTQDTPSVRQAYLEKLIERSTLVQAAREARLDQDPAVLEQIEHLLIGRLKELQLQPRLATVRITEEELRTEYESDPKFEIPERVHLAVLWYDTRGQARLVARYLPRLQAARASIAELPASVGFGRLALDHTEHRSSRYKGGDIGWLTRGSHADPWKREVLRIAESLRQGGECSEVIETDQGLFLVRLIECQTARVKPFEEVRQSIEHRLLSRRRQQVVERFQREILARVPVQRYPERLERLERLPVAEDPGPASSQLQLSAKGNPFKHVN